MYTYETIRNMCFVQLVCQQMLAQKLISFILTWLSKCAFSSLQKYEIQAKNQFNVYDTTCFASLLTTPKIQTNVEKMQKSIVDKIQSIMKKCSRIFFIAQLCSGPLALYQ